MYVSGRYDPIMTKIQDAFSIMYPCMPNNSSSHMVSPANSVTFRTSSTLLTNHDIRPDSFSSRDRAYRSPNQRPFCDSSELDPEDKA
jgi:hypothetical protein